MRLLITRPEPDGRELKDALSAQGHEVTLEPLLHIEFLPIAANTLENVQALLVTSRNGVRALAARAAAEAVRDLPIFCVGEGTAEAARENGFQHVTTGAGTARDLVPLVAAKAEPASGALLHIAGEHLAFDLAAALTDQGFDAHTLTAYRAVSASALSPSAAQSLREGHMDAVVLMSPRTATIFAQLVADSLLTESAKKLRYFCLSERVAEALGELAPGRREIAATPNSQAMLAAIARVATQPTGV